MYQSSFLQYLYSAAYEWLALEIWYYTGDICAILLCLTQSPQLQRGKKKSNKKIRHSNFWEKKQCITSHFHNLILKIHNIKIKIITYIATASQKPCHHFLLIKNIMALPSEHSWDFCRDCASWELQPNLW